MTVNGVVDLDSATAVRSSHGGILDGRMKLPRGFARRSVSLRLVDLIFIRDVKHETLRSLLFLQYGKDCSALMGY